jgi:hypothetical protein
MSNAKSLAIEFAYEYFQTLPEFIDVAEYVDENSDEEDTQKFVDEVYDELAAILQRIRVQAYAFLQMIEDEEL